MKAVVYYAPGDVRVEDVPPPECGEGDVLVDVDACAVCGSDLKSFRHGNPRLKPPLTLGHEFTGRIGRLGSAVSSDAGLSVGDRVVMATSTSCGKCFYCQRGWANLCVDLAPMGFSYPGGMAEQVVIPARAVRNGHVVRVEQDMPAKVACLAEPVSCAVNSLEQCDIQPGDTVLILGAGPMGLINACVARASGAGRVLLSEINPDRLAQAEGFDCDVLINPAEQDLHETVMRETDGLGADACIVAAPAAAAQEQAITLVRKRGTVVLFASLPKGNSQITLDSRPLHYGELRVVGLSDSTAEHVRRAVDLLARDAVPGEKLATHVMALRQIHEAFDLMTQGQSLRVVLLPGNG